MLATTFDTMTQYKLPPQSQGVTIVEGGANLIWLRFLRGISVSSQSQIENLLHVR